MITEDYVSFEIAKLLKEYGFNEPTLYYYLEDKYVPDGALLLFQHDGLACDNTGLASDKKFSAPTLQMAAKWLREKYNVHIWVEPSSSTAGLYNASVKQNWWNYCWSGYGYKSYERAVSASIEYCLKNLI